MKKLILGIVMIIGLMKGSSFAADYAEMLFDFGINTVSSQKLSSDYNEISYTVGYGNFGLLGYDSLLGISTTSAPGVKVNFNLSSSYVLDSLGNKKPIRLVNTLYSSNDNTVDLSFNLGRINAGGTNSSTIKVRPMVVSNNNFHDGTYTIFEGGSYTSLIDGKSYITLPDGKVYTIIEDGVYTLCTTFNIGPLGLVNGGITLLDQNEFILVRDINSNNNTKEYCMSYSRGNNSSITNTNNSSITNINIPSSTGSTTSPSTPDKEDLTITNVSTNGSYPKSILTITLANLGKADYDIGSKDPTVKLFCYQQGFKKFGISKMVTDYIGSSQPSISTTLNLKLRGSKKSVKNIICTIDSENALKESDERNNTYIFRI